MKKINELKQERASKLVQLSEINKRGMEENRAKTDAEKSLFNTLEKEVNDLDERINDIEKQEEISKRMGSPVETRTVETKPIVVEFRDWLQDAVHNNKTTAFNALSELRADPILASTDTGIITKTVNAGIDILTSPAEAFLRKLGVTFYTGLVGNFVVPSMTQDTATFPGEDASASSASMATESLTLAARRVTHTQRISRETLAQTNPGIYAGILQNLVNGVWNAVTNDVFDTIDSDGATQKSTFGVASTGLSNGAILQMEASMGGLNIGAGAYVTTPSVKAFLKKTIARGTTAGDAIWMGNEMNGYPAYGVPAANSFEVYFGDFSKSVVGQWGGLEIVVDPYKDAQKGQINLTIIGLFDTGLVNKRGMVILTDASIY